MSYIQHVLQPGEEIRYQGSVHWILYLPAIILCVVGAVSMAFGPPGWVIAAISISLAILLALRAWFIRWMTEIVVTDRRVIYAHGFIQRHSVEVHMDKVGRNPPLLNTFSITSYPTKLAKPHSLIPTWSMPGEYLAAPHRRGGSPTMGPARPPCTTSVRG